MFKKFLLLKLFGYFSAFTFEQFDSKPVHYMRKILVLTVVLFGTLKASAQQDPQFSMFMFNQLYFNPAYAGSDDAICAALSYRNQWMGFEGNPQTFLFSADGPFSLPVPGFEDNQLAGGLTVWGDQIGQESTTGVKGTLAYRFKAGPGRLSVGTSFGFLQKSLGNDWDASQDFMFDPSIPNGTTADGGFDMDFGLYYTIPKKLYVGISTTHLTAADLESASEGGSQLNYNIARHYYLTGGYEYEINSDWVLKPNLMVKLDGTVTSFDINAMVEYQSTIWGGASYRLGDGIPVMVGYNYQMTGSGAGGGMLKAGIGYDITTNELRQNSSGSLEVMVRYCFNVTIPPKVQRHRTVIFM